MMLAKMPTRCFASLAGANMYMRPAQFSYKSIRSQMHIPLQQRKLDKLHRHVHIVCSAAEQAAEGDTTTESTPDVTKLDIRVGTILSADDHPEADSLFVEQIDLGEEEGPRTIVSGLKKYTTVEALAGKKVLVLANLKARNMRGIKSHGMLLCASNAEHTEVEPLIAPEGAGNGERAFFPASPEEGADAQGEPAAPNQLQKKKFWEQCQPLLKTNESGLAFFGDGVPMMTSAGQVKAPSLCNASIS